VHKKGFRHSPEPFGQQPCSNADLLRENCLHCPDGLIPHARQEVQVGVESHSYVSVSQKPLDQLRVGILRKQQSSAGMPEVS
jgi:hypothetical protein